MSLVRQHPDRRLERCLTVCSYVSNSILLSFGCQYFAIAATYELRSQRITTLCEPLRVMPTHPTNSCVDDSASVLNTSRLETTRRSLFRSVTFNNGTKKDVKNKKFCVPFRSHLNATATPSFRQNGTEDGTKCPIRNENGKESTTSRAS